MTFRMIFLILILGHSYKRSRIHCGRYLLRFVIFVYGENDPRDPTDWSKAKKELENYGDESLLVYALPEDEYIVIDE